MNPTHAARALAANLRARQIAIKHVQALDLIAAGAGMSNRHVLASIGELPANRQVNIALLTTAATAIALHDPLRRQVIVDETSAILVATPAPDTELITREEYCLRILPSEADGRLLSLYERRVLRAQDRWDDVLDPDKRSAAISMFDRADATIFGSFASKAAFRTEGDALVRKAYLANPREQPALPFYTYSAIFAHDSDQLISCSIVENG